MIPYFQIPELRLGAVTIAPFGVMVSLAIVAGLWYSYKTAQREYGLGKTLIDMAPWFLLFGFATAHIVSIAFYFPQVLNQRGLWALLDFRSGLSSFGGLFGGALGAYIFIRRHRLPVLPWLDVLSRGFSLAYIFGRVGCSIAHDHPGLPTSFFLAMDYPARDGFAAPIVTMNMVPRSENVRVRMLAFGLSTRSWRASRPAIMTLSSLVPDREERS